MSDLDSQEVSQHILPLVAAFLGVSISILFSQFAISNIAFTDITGPRCSLTILTIIVSYFLVFYSISKVLHSHNTSNYILLAIFGISIIMILIGMSDITGTPIKILLWGLITIAFLVLWKTGIGSIHYWYGYILFPLLAISTIYSLTHSSELLIEDEGIWLENIDYDEDGLIHATLYLEMRALRYDANNIMVKIICSDQISLDEDECPLMGIDILEKNEEKRVTWNIVFNGKHSHSFCLYLASNEKISSRRITIYPVGDQWKAKIEHVGYLDNLVIFLENNNILKLPVSKLVQK